LKFQLTPKPGFHEILKVYCGKGSVAWVMWLRWYVWTWPLSGLCGSSDLCVPVRFRQCLGACLGAGGIGHLLCSQNKAIQETEPHPAAAPLCAARPLV
jgi:hypothetical protein